MKKKLAGAGWLRWLLLLLAVAVVAPLGWAAFERALAIRANTDLTRFDAIVVFGTSTDKRGKPSPDMLASVREGVREYERGVAPRLILTGGAAHNQWVESEVMAQMARAEGLPDAVLFLDRQSQDTIQNGCQAMQILNEHGWRSAELVSDASHLPRISLIFNDLPLAWRVHAAPPLGPRSRAVSAVHEAVETVKTARYVFWTRSRERCTP